MGDPEILPPLVGEAPAPEDPERVPWTVVDVLLIAVFSIFGLFFFAFVALGIAHALPAFRGQTIQQLAKDAGVILTSQLLMYAATSYFMVLVVRRYTQARFSEAIRWRWPGRVGVFLVGGLILAFAVQIFSRLLPIPKSLPIDELFRNARSAYLFAVFGIFVAPLFEELFFRGFLYPALRRHFDNAISVVITAFFFALIHQSQLAHAWGPLLMIFLVGVVLTMVRARTGSLAASFLVHAGYNATLFLMMYVVTDHFRHFEKMG